MQTSINIHLGKESIVERFSLDKGTINTTHGLMFAKDKASYGRTHIFFRDEETIDNMLRELAELKFEISKNRKL